MEGAVALSASCLRSTHCHSLHRPYSRITSGSPESHDQAVPVKAYEAHQRAQVVFGKAYEAEHVRRWMDYGASARAWDKFFGRYGLGGMPDYVSYVCCAQFAVSRYSCGFGVEGYQAGGHAAVSRYPGEGPSC